MSTDFLSYVSSLTYKLSSKEDARSLVDLYLEKTSGEETNVTVGAAETTDDPGPRPQTRADRLARLDSARAEARVVKANDILDDLQKKKAIQRQTANRRRLLRFKKDNQFKVEEDAQIFREKVDLSNSEKRQKINDIIAGSTAINPTVRPVILGFFDIPDLKNNEHARKLTRIKNAVREAERSEIPLQIFNPDFNFNLEWLQDVIEFFNARKTFLDNLDVSNIVEIVNLADKMNLSINSLKTATNTEILSYMNRELYVSTFVGSPKYRYSRFGPQSVTLRSDLAQPAEEDRSLGIAIPPDLQIPNIPFTPPFESLPSDLQLKERNWIDCFADFATAATLRRFVSRSHPNPGHYDPYAVIAHDSPAFRRLALAHDLMNSRGQVATVDRAAPSTSRGQFGLPDPMSLFLTFGRARKMQAMDQIGNNSEYTNVFADGDSFDPNSYKIPYMKRSIGNLIYDGSPGAGAPIQSRSLLESRLCYTDAQDSYNSAGEASEAGIFFNSFILSQGRIASMPFESIDFGSAPELPETAVDIISKLGGGTATSRFMQTVLNDGLLSANLDFDPGMQLRTPGDDRDTFDSIQDEIARIPSISPYVYANTNMELYARQLDDLFTTSEIGTFTDGSFRRHKADSPGIRGLQECNRIFKLMLEEFGDAVEGDSNSQSLYGILDDFSDDTTSIIAKAKGSAALAIFAMTGVTDTKRNRLRTQHDIRQMKSLFLNVLSYAMNHPGISQFVEGMPQFRDEIDYDNFKSEFPPTYDSYQAHQFRRAKHRGMFSSAANTYGIDLGNIDRLSSRGENFSGGTYDTYTHTVNDPANRLRAKLYEHVFGVEASADAFGFKNDDVSGVRGGGLLRQTRSGIASTARNMEQKPLAVLTYNANPLWAAISFEPSGRIRLGGNSNRNMTFEEFAERTPTTSIDESNPSRTIFGQTDFGGSTIDFTSVLDNDLMRKPACHTLDFLDHAAIGIYRLFLLFVKRVGTEYVASQMINDRTNAIDRVTGRLTMNDHSPRAPRGGVFSLAGVASNFVTLMTAYGQLVCPRPELFLETVGLRFHQKIHPYRAGSLAETERLEQLRQDARQVFIEEAMGLSENAIYVDPNNGAQIRGSRGDSLGARDEAYTAYSRLYATELANTSVYEVGFEMSTIPQQTIVEAVDSYIRTAVSSLNAINRAYRNIEDLANKEKVELQYGQANVSDIDRDSSGQVASVLLRGEEEAQNRRVANLQANLKGKIDSYAAQIQAQVFYNGGPTGPNPTGKDHYNFSEEAFRDLITMAVEIIKEDSFVVRTAAALSLYYDNVAKSAVDVFNKGMKKTNYLDEEVHVFDVLSKIPNLTPEHAQSLFASLHELNNTGEEPGGRKTIDKLSDPARVDFCLNTVEELSQDHNKIAVIGLPSGMTDSLERTPTNTTEKARKGFSEKEFEIEFEFYDLTTQYLPEQTFSTRFIKNVRPTGVFVPPTSKQAGLVPSFFVFDGDSVADARKVSADSIIFSEYTPLAYHATMNDLALKDFLDLYYDVDVRESAFPANPEYLSLMRQQKYPIAKISELDENSRLFLTASSLAFDPSKRVLDDLQFYSTMDIGGSEVPVLDPLSLRIESGHDVGVYNSIANFGNIQNNFMANLKFSQGFQFERVVCIPILKEYTSNASQPTALVNQPLAMYRSSCRMKLLYKGDEFKALRGDY